MSRDIAIVDMAEAKDEAESMGREIGKEYTNMKPGDLAHFKETTRWNHGVGKKLRIMAGNEDVFDKGTFHGERTVAVIPEANADDVPVEGFLSNSSEVYAELEEVWREGVFREVKDE